MNCRYCRAACRELVSYRYIPARSQHFPDRPAADGITLNVVECTGCGLVQLANDPVPYYREVIRAVGVSAEMAELQRSILETAAAAVRPGGVLVYATCSIFAAENRLNVEAFLAAHPEFSAEPFADPLTGGPVPSGMVSVRPGTEDCDAMFAARLRRRKEEVPS